MTSGDPTPRLLAAAASLTGTGILMCRPDPSVDGILIGLLCLGLWALGTLAARPGRVARPARSARPRVLEAVILETPRAIPQLLPAPRPASRAGASRLPEVPTHRQRVVERHTRQRP
ncbi:energy transducer TonB [Methylobacterium sp. J-070]|uniref:energy transducer TonB n=1 Tax=Methylobacterium sp. J-070 TaxID=2836650 RepID=UPI001FB9E3D1|nr:energy transducer TonB [Methylobacterium sp. J-070]MCJ2048664.1 energy transducer TonB [Methylobacterium sp. J-070]